MIMQVLVLEDDIKPKKAQGVASRFLVWRPLPLSDLEEYQVVYVTAADDFRWKLASSYQHKYATLQYAL